MEVHWRDLRLLLIDARIDNRIRVLKTQSSSLLGEDALLLEIYVVLMPSSITILRSIKPY